MALRIGSGVPFGDTTGDAGDTMRSRYSPQFVMEIAAGAKLSPSVYVGGYAGIGAGNIGEDTYTDDLCNGGYHDVSCSADSARFGVEVQYHFIPDGFVNPWVGYGLAYELAWQNIDDHIARRTETSTVSGFQFGRVEGGIDFRLGKVIGLGPYFLFEFGQYTHETTSVYGRETYSGSIGSTAMHSWFGSGLRLVFFP